MTLTQLFTAIADAIRSKKGTQTQIAAESFPTELTEISTGKLTASEKEEILDFNLMYVRGQSSLNYIIRRINELISFVNRR